jgi:hypothetical protein
MLDNLTAKSLAEHLNTKFSLHLPTSGILELVLINVDDFEPSPTQERFSILFQGPQDPALWQGTYKMEHSRLGTFDLFIVPVSREKDGMRYEAVFNRMRKRQ